MWGNNNRSKIMAKKQWLLATLIVTALATASPAALAKKKRISEAEAAAIANSAIGGRVVDVDYEHRKHGHSYYEVEIHKDGREYTVYVDAKTGRLTDPNGNIEVYPDNGESIEIYPDANDNIQIYPDSNNNYDPHGYYGYYDRHKNGSGYYKDADDDDDDDD